MDFQYLLLPLIGLAWTLVAVTVANARAKNISIFHFFLLGGAISALIFWVMNAFLGIGLEHLFSNQYRYATICFIVGSLLNSLGQAISMYNLKAGGRALAFAIPQLAFLLPYTWSLIFWNEKLTIYGISGLFLITLAICYLSLRKKNNSSAVQSNTSLDCKRLIVSFVAMMFIGASQIATSIPMLLKKENQLPAITGSMIIQIMAVIFFAICCIFSPVKFVNAVKASIKFSIMWAIGAVASYCILLPTIKIMATKSQSGIVYPVACSTLIMLFAIYTSVFFKEKLSKSQIVAFLAIIAGIFLVRM